MGGGREAGREVAGGNWEGNVWRDSEFVSLSKRRESNVWMDGNGFTMRGNLRIWDLYWMA